MKLAIADRAVVAATRDTCRSRILLSAAQPVRKCVVRSDVIHRGRRLVVPRTPGESIVHRDDGALVGNEQLNVRIVRIDPIALIVIATRRAAMRDPALSAVNRFPGDGVRLVYDVYALRIDRDRAFIVRFPRDAVVRRDDVPVFSCIVGAIERGSRRCSDHVQALGLTRTHRDLNAAQSLRGSWESLGQLLPRVPAVRALEEPARVVPRNAPFSHGLY